MELSLILILGSCILFAAVLYYFLFVKREADLGERGKAGIFTIFFVIAPIILIVLLMQFGAESRLEKLGFKPHPSFSSSVGAATGVGENPIWIFSATGNPDSIFQFYKDPRNHAGWSLQAENTNGLVFRKDKNKMSILINNGDVVFSLVTNE